MPTTSIAGDCVNAVIDEDLIFAKPCVSSSLELENLCIHILKPVGIWIAQTHEKDTHSVRIFHNCKSPSLLATSTLFK